VAPWLATWSLRSKLAVQLVDPYGITVDSERNEAFVTLRQQKQVIKLSLTVKVGLR
jgi:hypothetical protein